MRTLPPTLAGLALLPALAGLVLHASPARAQSGQPWLDDRRYGQGIGVRSGDLELHPGIAAQVGYDSNYFQNSGDVGVTTDGAFSLHEPVIDVARLRITPSLSLKTLSESRLVGGQQAAPPVANFEARGHVSYNMLFPIESSASGDSLSNFIQGAAGLQLDLLPERPWGADASLSVARYVQPNNDPLLPPAFSRGTYQGEVGIIWRPGGKKMSWRLAYGATYTRFELDIFTGYDNLAHGLITTGHWKFLPRTALLYEGRIGFVSYSDNASALADSKPMSTKLGLAGLLSNHVSLLTMLGWLSTFYEPVAGARQDYDGPIGQLQLTYYPSPQPEAPTGATAVGLSSVAVGYLRSVDNAYLGNYVRRDRVYSDLSYFVGGVVVLSLQGGLSVLGRPAATIGDSPGPNDHIAAFNEKRVDATAFAEWRTSNTFGINATVIYNAALDNQLVQARAEGTVPPGQPMPVENLRFDRYELWLGARWFL
jgi:hypothetical protein